MTDIDALVAEARDRLQSAEDDVKRFDHGEFDNGVMAEIRAENVGFFRAVVTALSALTTERAKVAALEAENAMLRDGLNTLISRLDNCRTIEMSNMKIDVTFNPNGTAREALDAAAPDDTTVELTPNEQLKEQLGDRLTDREWLNKWSAILYFAYPNRPRRVR
jgi:glutamate-1-semialdehyde aminotransferase